MRAKNEFRLISEAYDIKLLAEKAVDGTLMCSKDCCGSPVMECKCGDDCPHCNCFMIQKAVKEYGLKSPLLEANDNDTVVVTRNYSADDPNSTHNTRISKKDLEKFKKMGYKIKSEDGEEIEYENPATRRKEAQRAANERAHKKWQDPEYWKEFGVKGLGLDTPKEDNEEPKRGITGYQHTDALAQAAFAKKDKVDIDEIDLNKWREYPAEDVMKAVYRRYGKELPSVDSYDWAITWDKKVRPWLKEHEGNL